MSAHTSVEDSRRHRSLDVDPVAPQPWHGWGSPIGLGIGLLCVGGFFVLIAVGLAVLGSIG